MVQPLHDRLGRLLDVAVVDEVTLGRIDLAFDDDIKPKRVPVQPPAFMVGRERRQVVCRLEVEGFGESDEHIGSRF